MELSLKDNKALHELHDKSLEYRDLLKLPTLISAASLATVMKGCAEIDTIHGVNMVVLGRGGDLVDGFVARLLHQETDMGALVDTAFDKLGMTAIIGAAWHKNAVPKPVLATIGGKQALNASLTAIHAHRHPTANFRPTKAGKQAMFADNVALISYLYANAFELERPDLEKHEHFRTLGNAAFAAGIALSVPATATYVQRAVS